MRNSVFMPAAIRFIDWLGRNGSMSRQRLRFACEQRMEIVETLIESLGPFPPRTREKDSR